MSDSEPNGTERETLLTTEEVAAPFGVTTATVTRWAREGKLASFRTPGGQLRFRKSDVEAWLPPTDEDEPDEVAS